jgi:hypothetical protein
MVGGALGVESSANPQLDLARSRVLGRIRHAENHLRRQTNRADRTIAARHAGQPAPRRKH